MVFIKWLRIFIVHDNDILAASAVSQLVCFGDLFNLISSLKHALTTILSSSHSYNNYFYLSVNGSVSVNLSFSKPSLKSKSFGRVSIDIFVLPVCKVGYNTGHEGMKNYFLSVPTSITQSSYSIKWSRHGVVSNAGGTLTGLLKKPGNDIFIKYLLL